MADRPILFSAPMVRALLAGTKTQTRRVINPQPIVEANGVWRWEYRNRGRVTSSRDIDAEFPELATSWSRIQRDDRLYVREAWRVSKQWDDTSPRDLLERKMSIVLEAGGSIANEGDPLQWLPSDWPNGERPDWIGRFRQGMHMPRWASRLTLIVTDVRVQRLQECSEEDARAEGIAQIGRFYGVPDADWDFASTVSAASAYANLWDSLNADRGFGWDANPWVVAVSFQVKHGNIDQIGDAS